MSTSTDAAVASGAVDAHHHLWNPSDPGQGWLADPALVPRTVATALGVASPAAEGLAREAVRTMTLETCRRASVAVAAVLLTVGAGVMAPVSMPA